VLGSWKLIGYRMGLGCCWLRCFRFWLGVVGDGGWCQDSIFNMKLTAQQLGKLHLKAVKDHTEEIRKCKEAMKKGNEEGARVHAENAVRAQNSSMKYLKLQSRLEAVVSKLEVGNLNQRTADQMAFVTKRLGEALGSTDVVTITSTMERFESQFKELEVRSEVVNGQIDNTMAGAAREDHVLQLMQKVADQNHLEVGSMVGGPRVGTGTGPASLQERLEALQKR